MRVFVSVDMEGVSGVTRWADVVTRGQDYERARRWMTHDVNAAVAGARAAGATELVVEENHGTEMLCNLVLDEIDPEVEVVRGQPRGGATTMSALDGTFDAVFLVGHHAGAGDYPGICAHTISYTHYKDVRLAGRSVSEGEMFALAAAEHGVPTVLITGDDVVTELMRKLVPAIEVAVVKRALSREAAAVVPPARAWPIVYDAAERALQRLARGEIEPPEARPPYALEVQLREALSERSRAVVAERFPELAVSADGTVVSFEADGMERGFRMAAIVQFLATEPERVRGY